jgi:metallophosphoesterase (TIGR00282 family)
MIVRILYIGDVVGEFGLTVVERLLPSLRKKEAIDLVIAQAENVTEGRGISSQDFKRLLAAGVDFASGGNWILYEKDIYPLLNDPAEPIIRPANFPKDTPGLGYKYAHSSVGDVLVVSLLGHVVGRDADRPMDNPLKVIDAILTSKNLQPHVATIVNFHGDFSSEKYIIGYYLDGKVTAAIGDHWHIPTADAMVLPKGTAHITDVGMCGSLDSSLGIDFDSVIPRWRDDKSTRNILVKSGRSQINSLLIEVDPSSGLATTAKQIRIVEDL